MVWASENFCWCQHVETIKLSLCSVISFCPRKECSRHKVPPQFANRACTSDGITNIATRGNGEIGPKQRQRASHIKAYWEKSLSLGEVIFSFVERSKRF